MLWNTVVRRIRTPVHQCTTEQASTCLFMTELVTDPAHLFPPHRRQGNDVRLRLPSMT